MRCLGGKHAVSGKGKKCCVCRRVRELHFVDIVDVEQLLDVMGQDVPQVAERVQRLLLPSYFPGACHCHAVCVTQRLLLPSYLPGACHCRAVCVTHSLRV